MEEAPWTVESRWSKQRTWPHPDQVRAIPCDEPGCDAKFLVQFGGEASPRAAEATITRAAHQARWGADAAGFRVVCPDHKGR